MAYKKNETYLYIVYGNMDRIFRREAGRSKGLFLHAEINKHKLRGHTSVSREEFESTIPVFDS